MIFLESWVTKFNYEIDFSSMHPTLLKTRYDEIKFANVNIFASLLLSFVKLAVPSVSKLCEFYPKKRHNSPPSSLWLVCSTSRCPLCKHLCSGLLETIFIQILTPAPSKCKSLFNKNDLPVRYFPTRQQKPTGRSQPAIISRASGLTYISPNCLILISWMGSPSSFLSTTSETSSESSKFYSKFFILATGLR